MKLLLLCSLFSFVSCSSALIEKNRNIASTFSDHTLFNEMLTNKFPWDPAGHSKNVTALKIENQSILCWIRETQGRNKSTEFGCSLLDETGNTKKDFSGILAEFFFQKLMESNASPSTHTRSLTEYQGKVSLFCQGTFDVERRTHKNIICTEE